jgi:hypothetical protein
MVGCKRDGYKCNTHYLSTVLFFGKMVVINTFSFWTFVAVRADDFDPRSPVQGLSGISEQHVQAQLRFQEVSLQCALCFDSGFLSTNNPVRLNLFAVI